MRKIFLTCDTECHDFEQINQYIWGRKKEKYYGLKKILEVADELHITVNFFFDIVECKRYGDQYAKDIIELIKSHNQPIWLHLHPNFVSEDDSRTFLWEYSKDEQKEIFEKGIEEYERLCGACETLVYRAGRYGVNPDSYAVMHEVRDSIIDLSYCPGDNGKMCKLSADEVGSYNIPTQYKGVTLLPNTSYIGFDYFGHKHYMLLNVAQTPTDEFKQFIKKTKLNNVVYTMHVWDFIKKWYFIPNFLWGNKMVIRRLKNCVKYAEKCGFTFSPLSDFTIDTTSEDEVLSLYDSFGGKLRGIVNNFIRFQGISRLSPKFFFLYLVGYTGIVAALVLALNLL